MLEVRQRFFAGLDLARMEAETEVVEFPGRTHRAFLAVDFQSQLVFYEGARRGRLRQVARVVLPTHALAGLCRRTTSGRCRPTSGSLRRYAIRG